MYKYKVGDTIISPKYGTTELLEYKGEFKWRMRYIKTGYEFVSKPYQVKTDEITDRLAPTLYGKGCLGYAPEKGNEKEYSLFYNMIKRCYGGFDNTYNGVTVCERWLRFDYFIEDIPILQNYDKWLQDSYNWQLDKDALQWNVPREQRVYSKNGCMFVSRQENMNYTQQPNMESFIVIYPNGNIEKCIGISKFAKEHKLHRANIQKCLNGLRTHTGGYKFKRAEGDDIL